MAQQQEKRCARLALESCAGKDVAKAESSRAQQQLRAAALQAFTSCGIFKQSWFGGLAPGAVLQVQNTPLVMSC